MKQSKRKIAVTGGIGSGKSTVCKFIAELGYPVISFDEVYARLLDSGCLTEKLVEVFGNEVIEGADGKVNRAALARVAFACEENTKKLNEITHPAIFNDAFEEAKKYTGDCFFEVPILFEGGYEKLFDCVVVVLRDTKARILSVMERDNITNENVVKRINRQFNYDNLEFAKYYVIHNQGNIDDLRVNCVKLIDDISLKQVN